MIEETPEVDAAVEPTKNKWDKRIQKAEKYLDKSWTHGRKVYARYQDDRDNGDYSASIKRANLFYANVNTLKESLFNSLPKPEVTRVHKGDFDDDVARVASLMMQRALNYEVQCSTGFAPAIKHAILDRLVPGLGQVWVRFEANPEQPGSERMFLDTVYWEDFIYEPTRTWQEVMWAGRRLELSKQEVVERWGEQALTQIAAPKNPLSSSITPKEISADKYYVYEIWDKAKKQVNYVSIGMDNTLETKDDPYGLKDFYPFPCPLLANPTTTSFLPVTDYHIAQDQYGQLDVLYARISLIIEAIKVAGVYDASETAIGNMLEGQENKLVPVDNWAMYAEKGGAKGCIDWYPVEQIAVVLQQLQGQFEAVKSLLQEITGMADIMRGASNQYETAAAQQIKAQFASVRMNGYQRDVSEFVRDILRIMGDMMTNLYTDQKMMDIIGPINQADQQYIQPAAQVLRSQMMSMYKIDIQADSLTQSDWALEKQSKMELVGYISQFLQAAVPAVESNPELGTMLMSILKFSITGFKGGAELEGVIDQQLAIMEKKAQQAEGQEKEPTAEETKAQAEQAKMQMEMQLKQMEAQQNAQLKNQEMQAKLSIEQAQAQLDAEVQKQRLEGDAMLQQQKMQNQMQLQEMELAFLERKYMLELKFKQNEQQMKLESSSIQAHIKSEAAEEAAEIKRGGTENGKD